MPTSERRESAKQRNPHYSVSTLPGTKLHSLGYSSIPVAASNRRPQRNRRFILDFPFVVGIGQANHAARLGAMPAA